MSTPNDQQLPPGLAPVATPQVPGAPAGASVVTMPNPTPAAPAAPAAPAVPLTYEQYHAQFLKQAPQVPAGQEPPPAPVFQNPMLTTLAPPAPVTAAPAAPAAPATPPPAEPAKPEPTKPEPAAGPVGDLAGALGADPQLAPGIAYLEAAAADAKLDVQRAFGNAADELDARFIDRAYLVEQVGQAKADQMVKVAEASIAYATQFREALYTDVRKLAGEDAGAWDAAVAIWNQHADAQTKAVLGPMFDSMDRNQMMYAAQQLVDFARKTGGTVQPSAQPLGTPASGQGLTAEQYREELTKLARNAPDYMFDNLRARRAAGMKAGI